MCQEAGITEDKVGRHKYCGEIDEETGMPKKNSAQPLICQKGLKTVCGIDVEAVQANPDSMSEDNIDHESLCSKECKELVNSKHCKAMGLDNGINSEETCARLSCKVAEEDSHICEEDICAEKCVVNRPECKFLAKEMGVSDIQLAECAVKKGEMTQEELDEMKAQLGDDNAPSFDPGCIEHDACGEGDNFCNKDCPLGKLQCAGTRRTLGLSDRPWEVQCTAEQYGPKPCDTFDDFASQAAKKCNFKKALGDTWETDTTEVLCKRASKCFPLAQKTLLGYSLKCMLNKDRRKEMKDGGIMYYNKDDPMSTGLVNLFFFECPNTDGAAQMWMNPPSYVKPYKPPKAGPQQPVSGTYEEEDLSKDADDEGDTFKVEEVGDVADAFMGDQKDPMDDESFKMRYDLGELTEDEMAQLKEDDFIAYVESSNFDKSEKYEKDADAAKDEL